MQQSISYIKVLKELMPRQWAESDRSQKINIKIFFKIIDSQAPSIG
jgi:hypothetical protein